LRCGRRGVEVALPISDIAARRSLTSRRATLGEVDVRKKVAPMVRWAAMALCLAAIGGGLIACGASNDPDDTSNGGATGIQAYLDCLASNGVTLDSRGPGGAPSRFPSGPPSAFRSRQPGPGGPGGGGSGGLGGFGDQAPEGVDQETWRNAQQACASVRPTAGPGGGPGGGAGNPAFTAYLNCLSDHGVTATGGPNQLNTADATVAEAMKACEALRPTNRPRPTATGSS
jgi:hypothetical protein